MVFATQFIAYLKQKWNTNTLATRWKYYHMKIELFYFQARTSFFLLKYSRFVCINPHQKVVTFNCFKKWAFSYILYGVHFQNTNVVFCKYRDKIITSIVLFNHWQEWLAFWMLCWPTPSSMLLSKNNTDVFQSFIFWNGKNNSTPIEERAAIHHCNIYMI